jgi:S1-C subfamily serine protease
VAARKLEGLLDRIPRFGPDPVTVTDEADDAFPAVPGGEAGQTDEFEAQASDAWAPAASWDPLQPPPPPQALPPGFGASGPAYQPGPGHAPGSWAYGPADLGWGQPADQAYVPTARQAAWPSRRPGRGWVVVAATAAVVLVAAIGGFVGHALAGSDKPVSSAAGTTPRSNGGFPYGNGFEPGSGNGTGGAPYGGSGPSGTAPNSGGAGPADASSIAARVDGGLVDINTTVDYGAAQAAGTGMVLTSGGEVLTNNHVIDGATSISVTDVGNGRTYDATVVGYNVTKDVAVLQLTGASGLQSVTTAGGAASAGEEVVGIGNAGGSGGTPSYAGGTVTATNQSITASDDLTGTDENLTGMIETNADIQSGDSGGPLVNSSGQVIGMDTAGSETSGFISESSGSGYAIPIGVATSIAQQIVAGQSSGTVHVGATAFLGVQLSQSQSGLGPGSGSSTASGVQISGVVSGSPAAGAGLANGDVITAVAGRGVTSQSSLEAVMVNDLKPGEQVTVQYTDTAGQQRTVSVVLASGPPS